jgi:cellulose synthase/poly-beta-1,6-N-acetylglucosamine synthase-like glycosyltransferase
MKLVFWVSFGVFFYTVLVYPAFMTLLGKLFHRPLRRGGEPRSVSLIIAACNEERHIGRALDQALEAEYPRDLLEIVVATDRGSTDRTHEIVRAYEDRGIRLITPPGGQIGKNVSIDAAMRETTGDIVLFADATAIWSRRAIRDIVAGFADPTIGCISARKAYWLEEGFGPASYRRYWFFEWLIDRGSSVFGYIPNASGGMHALRRGIYRSVPPHMIRDLIDPAQTVGQGYRAVLDPDIPYLDAPWRGAREVYRARVRITMRALSSTPYILGQLVQGGRYGAILLYASHKLLRWLLWLPAAGLLASSLWLAPFNAFFVHAGLIQALFYGAVPVALAAARAGRSLGPLTHWAFFVLSLTAMGHAFGLWAAGRKKATWRLREEAVTP